MNGNAVGLIILASIVGYLYYVIHNRKNFNTSQGNLLLILTASFLLGLLSNGFQKNIDGYVYGLSPVYTGLLFTALSFGEIGGIMAGIGAGVAEYFKSSDSIVFEIFFVAYVAGGFLAGRIARGDSSFSTLILGSVIGALAIMAIHYAYLLPVRGLKIGEAYVQTSPLLASVTTGVILGTGLAALFKKWDKWPEPIGKI
ncbi:hypothetical protein [Thermococcus gorgonarius]|nr:hypothetical protein [Thermococcus gorgonarius]